MLFRSRALFVGLRGSLCVSATVLCRLTGEPAARCQWASAACVGHAGVMGAVPSSVNAFSGGHLLVVQGDLTARCRCRHHRPIPGQHMRLLPCSAWNRPLTFRNSPVPALPIRGGDGLLRGQVSATRRGDGVCRCRRRVAAGDFAASSAHIPQTGGVAPRHLSTPDHKPFRKVDTPLSSTATGRCAPRHERRCDRWRRKGAGLARFAREGRLVPFSEQARAWALAPRRGGVCWGPRTDCQHCRGRFRPATTRRP